jgi:nitrate reductase molybdenum cofactor assembly chaperone NarJ/NarW
MKASASGPATGAPVDAGARDATAVTLQAASVLLSYPAADGGSDLDIIAAALAVSPHTAARRHLERFLAWYGDLDSGTREQIYVATFDFDPGHSLYLTEAQPRTSRKRGTALLELRQAYRSTGVDVRTDELPDYLPLMLEVAAHAPACRELLANQRGALRRLAEGLERAGSPFALVTKAVLAVTPARPSRGPQERRDER